MTTSVPNAVLVQERQEGVALGAGQPADVGGEARVDEQRLLARLGVHAHDGVLDRLERQEPLALPPALVHEVEDRLALRPAGGGTAVNVEMGHGDLLVMGGSCQRTWEHAVPKVAAAGPRMSVQFRPLNVF